MDEKNMIKKGWIKAQFIIEVMAAKEETVDKSLKKHIDKLKKEKDVEILESSVEDIEEVKNPPKNVDKAYSQVIEISLMVKGLFGLIRNVLLYGPSSIEIIEPKEIKTNIDELQAVANAVSGILHQYASAGVGGLVITPDKK